MGCEHLDEYYEVFLLGTISDGACADIREHVEGDCPYCLGHLREAALSVYLLSLSPRSVRPDPKQKSQLLRRLRKK
jgi:hypothetical protein